MTDKNYDIQKQRLPVAEHSTVEITVFQHNSFKTGVTFIFTPAMGVPAAYYKPFALGVADQGWAAVIMELRGAGASSVRASRKADFGYHEFITEDIPEVIHTAERMFPENRIILAGHSLGGQLNTLFAALNPQKVDALVFIAACTVYYKGWPFPKNIGVLAGAQAAAAISKAMGYFPGHRIGFGGREARRVILDWARNARTGEYRIQNNDADFESLARQIDLPVLSLSFKGDQLCPERAARHLTGKLKRADVTHIHLSEKDTPYRSLHHFRWAKESDAVIRKIRKWSDEIDS